jgi:hypothetical protein
MPNKNGERVSKSNSMAPANTDRSIDRDAAQGLCAGGRSIRKRLNDAQAKRLEALAARISRRKREAARQAFIDPAEEADIHVRSK